MFTNTHLLLFRYGATRAKPLNEIQHFYAQLCTKRYKHYSIHMCTATTGLTVQVACSDALTTY